MNQIGEQVTSSNGSMAIWCTPRPSTIMPSMEAHLNYWRVAGLGSILSGKYKEDFLEIGVLLRGSEAVENIKIFVPVVLDYPKIPDLGPKFSESDVAQGIFNDIFHCSAQARGTTWIELADKSRNLFCRVHVFASDKGAIDASELELSRENGGTLLTISRQAIANSSLNLLPGDRIYFRLRLFVGTRSTSPFVRVISPKDRYFQSGFDEIEYVDFRLNESRTLPDRIDRQMIADTAPNSVPTTLIAFLTAVPVVAELSVSNTAFHKNRLLESKPWNAYAPRALPKGMVVYHWKKSANDGDRIDNFAAFVKLQTRRSGWYVILVYLIIAFLFGILGNLSASWLQAKTGWPSASEAGPTNDITKSTGNTPDAATNPTGRNNADGKLNDNEKR